MDRGQTCYLMEFMLDSDLRIGESKTVLMAGPRIRALLPDKSSAVRANSLFISMLRKLVWPDLNFLTDQRKLRSQEITTVTSQTFTTVEHSCLGPDPSALKVCQLPRSALYSRST